MNNSLKVFHYRPIDVVMADDCGDNVTYFRISREIADRIATFTKRANEGKDLYAAKDFCSFIQWSGILTLLEQNASLGDPLPVDGKALRQDVERLAMLVCDKFRENSKTVTLEMSALESIHHKLDLIAGQVARIPVESQAVEFRPVIAA